MTVQQVKAVFSVKIIGRHIPLCLEKQAAYAAVMNVFFYQTEKFRSQPSPLTVGSVFVSKMIQYNGTQFFLHSNAPTRVHCVAHRL